MSRRVALFLLAVSLTAGCQTVPPARDLSKAAPGTTFNDQGDYLIGRGDVLGVLIHGDDTLSGSFTVDDVGRISMPLVGFLAVEGLTAAEFQQRAESSLAPYVKVPKVAAWVADRRSFRAYFCGEVVRVGPVQLTEPVSLLQGLALAGGLTPYATRQILILRKTTRGRTERYQVNYNGLINDGRAYDSFHINRGDTIIAE